MRHETKHRQSNAHRKPVIALTLFAFLVAGCGGSDGAAGGRAELPAVPDDAFYVPPDELPSMAPGTLIRSEEVAPIATDSRTFAVLYASESLGGESIAVSGLVVVPDAPTPEGGFNVVSWAHGTKGIADVCAPSRGFSAATHDFFDIAPELIDAGYVAVSSDYEGLGTPGIHPYLVGESQARGSLDIVRAAAQMEPVDAVGQVAVWGRSQGGQTALFASEIAATWAPELDVAGVIPAAPACCLELLIGIGPSVPGSRGLIWMAAVAFADTFDLDLDATLSLEAREAIEQLIEDEVCFEEWVEAARDFDNAGIVIDVTADEAWSEALRQSSPAQVATDIPILLLQGTADITTPQVTSDILANTLCNLGTSADYRVFEGFSHNDSTAMNMPLMLEWTAARFSGEAAGSTCQ